MNDRPMNRLGKYTLTILVTLVFILPLIGMVLTSLREPAAAAGGFSLWPGSFRWQNYLVAGRATNFPRQFINSLVVALGVTLADHYVADGRVCFRADAVLRQESNLPCPALDDHHPVSDSGDPRLHHSGTCGRCSWD